MDLYQVCSNYDPRAKNGPAPGGPHVLHGLMENKKKSSCVKAQIIEPWYFGIKYHLVDLFQLCSRYTPWPKMFPSQLSHDLHRL